MTVKAFLESLTKSKPSKLLKFVTGNQSADMDSVVSAITYAYFYNQKYPTEQPFLPLVNITRDELNLRKDIVLLLQQHSISSSLLYFLDDLKVLASKSMSPLEVVLVDHCNLQGELLTELHELGRLRVTGIIDHHADEEVFKDAAPRIIHSNGSCSSLVFNYWRAQLGLVNDADVVLLLLGPLLIDTSNMTQKVELGDIEAFGYYKEVLSKSVLMNDNFALFYADLKSEKKNLDLFTFFDILRKDYKQFKFTTQSGRRVAVGFSSIGKLMSWICKKFPANAIVDTIDEMKRAFHLDIVVITTSYTQKESGKYTREFCFSTQEEEYQELYKHADSLQLDNNIYELAKVAAVMQEVNASIHFKVYNQANIAASRKQVVPVVKDILESHL